METGKLEIGQPINESTRQQIIQPDERIFPLARKRIGVWSRATGSKENLVVQVGLTDIASAFLLGGKSHHFRFEAKAGR